MRYVLGSSGLFSFRKRFFYYFALRGVQEQHNLTPQQFRRFPLGRSVYDESVYYE